MKLISVVLLATSTVLAQSNTDPQINGVTVSASPSQITITGVRFGNVKPIVMLDELTLPVLNNTDVIIVAELASLPPGTYALSVANGQNHQTGSFAVTIGSVGPQGPAGPQGLMGLPGPSGTSGANGTNGVSGYVRITKVQIVFIGTPPGTSYSVVASCPATKRVLGGGYYIDTNLSTNDTHQPIRIDNSFPTVPPGDAWQVDATITANDYQSILRHRRVRNLRCSAISVA